MSVNKAKQRLFEEYLRWRKSEGKDVPDPALVFYGWVKQSRSELVSDLNLFTRTGYQELANWVQTWEQSKN